MKSSLNLGSIAGIKIRVHWTFLFLIAWIVFLELSRGNGLTAILWSTFFILVLFFCVVLHELGHALTARKYNIGTRQITLLPIGGVASLESMPDEPAEELLVALAGPAVNIVIAMALYFVVPFESFLNQDPEALQEALSSINAGNFIFLLFSANLMLAVFNMIPAFPMDGGRVLRAILSMRMDRLRATQIASMMGQGVAFLLFFLGLLTNPILVLIAIFVFFGAKGENMMIQQLALLKDHKLKEAMMTDITVFHPDDILEEVIDKILSGTERDFVVAEESEVKGILLQADLMQAIRAKDTGLKVGEIMRKDFTILNANSELTEIYRTLYATDRQFFPVFENGELVGAVDMNNVNEFLIFRAPLDF